MGRLPRTEIPLSSKIFLINRNLQNNSLSSFLETANGYAVHPIWQNAQLFSKNYESQETVTFLIRGSGLSANKNFLFFMPWLYILRTHRKKSIRGAVDSDKNFSQTGLFSGAKTKCRGCITNKHVLKRKLQTSLNIRNRTFIWGIILPTEVYFAFQWTIIPFESGEMIEYFETRINHDVIFEWLQPKSNIVSQLDIQLVLGSC